MIGGTALLVGRIDQQMNGLKRYLECVERRVTSIETEHQKLIKTNQQLMLVLKMMLDKYHQRAKYKTVAMNELMSILHDTLFDERPREYEGQDLISNIIKKI